MKDLFMKVARTPSIGGAALRLFLLASLVSWFAATSAYAASDSQAAISGGTSAFDQPSMFRAGEKSAGVGFVSNWFGGVDVTGSYFLFDDLAVQADLASISYGAPIGTTNVTYFDVAGVYHYKLGSTPRRWNYGWYGGLGVASGTATWNDKFGLQQSTFLGGLYWTAGFEMKFTPVVRAQVGVGPLAFNLGVNLSF
ncbi:MAG: hypothetical protein HY098_04540 [Nitrospinae bacterium]|nr:hypothetical protein [Nitrospinota bacterium]